MLERISYIFVEQLIASIELDSRVKTCAVAASSTPWRLKEVIEEGGRVAEVATNSAWCNINLRSVLIANIRRW